MGLVSTARLYIRARLTPTINVYSDEVACMLHVFVGIILFGIPGKAFLHLCSGIADWRTVFWRIKFRSTC